MVFFAPLLPQPAATNANDKHADDTAKIDTDSGGRGRMSSRVPRPPPRRKRQDATLTRRGRRRKPKSSRAGARVTAAATQVSSPMRAAKPNERIPWLAENSSDA